MINGGYRMVALNEDLLHFLSIGGDLTVIATQWKYVFY